MTNSRDLLLEEARTTRDLDTQMALATCGDWEVETQLQQNPAYHHTAVFTEQCRLFLATMSGAFVQAEYDRLVAEDPLVVQREASAAAAEYTILE